jgi:toxin-antitoxin system PIN domain toxin
VIAVDTNVLVYAHRSELSKHEAALERLSALAEGAVAWAIPVFCVGEFLRVITHPRLFDPPHSVAEACEALDRVLAAPSLSVLTPGDRYAVLLTEAMREADVVGNLVFDAQVVAVCREAGVGSLLTEDRDFDRFSDFPTSRIEQT